MAEAPADPSMRRQSLRRRRAALKAAVLVSIAGATAYSAVRMAMHAADRDGAPVTAPSASASAAAPAFPPAPVAAPASPRVDVPDRARYVFIGGGPVPESTEVSLEQDLILARRVLPGPGVALFAGGADAFSVRELDPTLRTGNLLTRLGDLFHPRTGRTSRYRRSSEPALAASLGEVERTLSTVLEQGGPPVTVYVAAHGEKGAERRSNYVALWGDEALTVEHLARIHDAHPRPMRFVSATCFAGGFAELAFESADATRGPTDADRCGLFATTWDREASGCDPNPDRRGQESYSLHMLSALGGKDRAGEALDEALVDLNGDDRISLLEAHTRARVASRSIDVPTTTSERLVRSLQKAPGRPAVDLLPEEVAVIQGLSAALGLRSALVAKSRWEELDAELERLDDDLARADEDVDQRFRALRAVLLGRWPVLDDPYHPDFWQTLSAHEPEIVQALEKTEEGGAFAQAQERLRLLEDDYFDRLVDEAVVYRLVRAHETLGLVGGLRARGGRGFAAYQRLLECERGVP